MTANPAIDLESVHNFRAVEAYATAGGRLQSGRIYRSGALDVITPSDVAYLRDDLGVATILDLRHPDELGEDGISHPLREHVVHLSIFAAGESQQAVIAELNGLYGPGISPERYLHYLKAGGSQFVRAFELFAREDSYPMLVHCTAGKDRTGVLLALVLDVLGVSHEEIAADYGKSEASIPRLIAFLERSGRVLEGTPEEIRARLATPPEKMAGFLRLLSAKYGGAEAYLRANGVTEVTIGRVRDLLIAPA
ncbi:MAG: tyrosine-protein phosphatase [Dehalococcoidia bacterium]